MLFLRSFKLVKLVLIIGELVYCCGGFIGEDSDLLLKFGDASLGVGRDMGRGGGEIGAA